ncbi:MAG: hypothetical protein V3T83_12250 [Acidobacteriota bacterium]
MAKKTLVGLCFLLIALASNLQAEELYKAMMVRAAPGKLLDFIQLYKGHMTFYDDAGDARPFWMRHSQGDQWDILFLFPMGSFSEYYSPQRVQKRAQAFQKRGMSGADFEKKFYELAAWHEEVFVDGPPPEQVSNAFKGAGYFHVEMFISLPGQQANLHRQREMENVYLKALGRPQNLIFTHQQGAAWDLFTLGFYRDLKHFAESADIPEDKENAAARQAGFESASAIGPYLRTLIAQHHDTLATAIR